ncbi:hypothetical protein EV127DRAFT_405547 [Xylaria flabelliformis]|nr:hypothetical protein EV127DRAFT_405547 [Xylaria flabelliformis]
MEYRTKEPENQSAPQRFGRWLSLKQYQIEVTFGVYMFTPTEKFIFFLTSPLFLVRRIPTLRHGLHRHHPLPATILFIINRAWFYVNGGENSGAFGSSNVVAAAKNALSLSLESTNDITSTATETLREL